MKIKGLDDKIAPLLTEDPKAEESMPTYRRVMLLSVGNVSANGEKDSVAAYEIVEKIKTEKDHVKLDEEQMKILMTCLQVNPMKFPVAVLGPVFKRIGEAEKD